MFILLLLTAMTYQRLSVPSLRNEKWKTYIIQLSSTFSVLSLIGILYYNKEVIDFSKKLKLVDNSLWMCYIVCTYIYCLVTYNLLSKLDVDTEPLCNNYLAIKRFLLCIMSVQCICCK